MKTLDEGKKSPMVRTFWLPGGRCWAYLKSWLRNIPLWRWLAGATRWHRAFALGIGLAMLSSIGVLVILPRANDEVTALLASHQRGTEPANPLLRLAANAPDLAAWFADKLDFTPRVKPLAATRFRLAGGRVDYIGGRFVAITFYDLADAAAPGGRIELYCWPARDPAGQDGTTLRTGQISLHAWREGDLQFWAVTGLSQEILREFVAAWKAAPG